MYQPYLTYDEYTAMGGTLLTSENAISQLKKASRQIDSLTYNRILKYGFNKLSDFQQEVIKEVTKILVDFYIENDEVLTTVLKNYSINGVSMSLDGFNVNVTFKNGIALPASEYELLMQTGLTTGSFCI
jgi:hypothetical protein